MASLGALMRCDAAAAQRRSSSRNSGHGTAGTSYTPGGAPLQQHTSPSPVVLGGSASAALTTALGAGRGVGRRRSSSTHSSSTSVVTASQQMSSSAGTKSSEYNRTMKEQMGWAQLDPYEYHYERGLYYHEVSPNLICGSQPRNAEDVAYLKREESVTTVLNLQQDKDLQHWGVKLDQLQAACKHHGIELIRRPARDFDPHSLRKTLPSAVSALHEAVANNGRVYVHCTAGLGRAPAVCIAYLYWFRGMQLDEAYKHLTDIRPCGPKKDAVRGATYDCLSSGDFLGFDRLPREAFASLSAEDRYVLQYRILKGAV